MLRNDAAAGAAGAGRGARLPAHRAVPARGLPAVLRAPAGRRRDDRGDSAEGAGAAEPAWRSPRCCRSTSGRRPDEDERQAAVRYWRRAIADHRRPRLRRHELGVQRAPRAGGGERGAVLALAGGAAPGSSSGRACGSCSNRTPTTSSEDGRRRGRPDPRHRQRARLVPVLRAAHVPPGRRPRRRHAVRRAAAHPAAHRRHVRPHRLRPGCATSSTRRGRPRASISISTSGQGEVDWDLFFATLAEVGFDGIATVCVFAWEERARESLRFNREKVQEYLGRHAVAGA